MSIDVVRSARSNISILACVTLELTGMGLWPGPARAEQVACPATVPFPNGIRVVKAIRVFTAANGESDFETLSLNSESRAYFKPGELFTFYSFGAVANVKIVSGPPNVKIAPMPSPVREYFLTLQGSSTITLADGRTELLTPGSLVLIEDMKSKIGHAGGSGPCGYVSVNIIP